MSLFIVGPMLASYGWIYTTLRLLGGIYLIWFGGQLLHIFCVPARNGNATIGVRRLLGVDTVAT